MSLFEAAREEATHAGLPFKWFTNITGFSSFVFNPFRQSHVPFLTTNQLTQGMLQALALEYGEDYGRGYYSSLNEAVLATYMKHHRKNIPSFKHLHAFVSDQNAYRAIGSLDDWEKTRHLAAVVDKLAQVEPLNVIAEDFPGRRRRRSSSIKSTCRRILREKQVIYFYLSSAQEQTTVAKVAKLAMFALLTAASRRGKGEKNRVYVFVDEFQRVISDNISIFFEQARQKKLHFLLANQTIGQLDRNGVDLTDVVESCTAFKQSFRATDQKSIQRLIETSGEARLPHAQLDAALKRRVRRKRGRPALARRRAQAVAGRLRRARRSPRPRARDSRRTPSKKSRPCRSRPSSGSPRGAATRSSRATGRPSSASTTSRRRSMTSAKIRTGRCSTSGRWS